MDDDEARRRLAAAPVARLGTHGPGGRIDLVPITFAVVGDELVTAVDHKPKRTLHLQRLANIEADPRVTVLVDHYALDWDDLWWVRVRGRARVVADGPGRDAALDALAAKYEPYRERRPEGAVIGVTLDELRAWSAR